MAAKAVARPDEVKKKPSRSEAAAKIASLIEEQMTERGLSGEEKNERVERFGKRVDEATARHAKRR